MATADKLKRLIQTKNDLKDTANDSDVVEITNEPFNVYSDKFKEIQDTLKSYIPQNSVSGYPINIKDAVPLSAKENVIYGNSWQETRSGKNKLNVVGNKVSLGVSSIGTADGKIVCKGITTSTEFYITDTHNINLPSGTYTFSIQETIDKPLKLKLETELGNLWFFISIGSKEVTFTSDYGIRAWQIYIDTNTLPEETIDYVLYPMLESGDKATEYEPFGVSPSPDYPSEVKCVEGIENLLNLDKSLWENGSFVVANGDLTFTTNRLRTTQKIKLKPNKEYTLSRFITESLFVYQPVIYFYTKDGTYLGSDVSYTSFLTSFPFSFIAPDKVDYCLIAIRHSDNSDINLEELDNDIRFQLEKSTISHTYVPYGSKYLVENIEKSLLDSKFRQNTANGSTNATRIFTSNPVYLKPGKYIFKTNLSTDFQYAFNGSSQIDENNFLIDPLTVNLSWFTSSSYILEITKSAYVGILIRKVNNANIIPDDVINFQFYLYENDKSQQYLIPLKKENHIQNIQSLWSNQSFSIVNGTFFDSTTRIRLTEKIKLKPNQIYTLNKKEFNDKYNYQNVLYFYKEDETYLGSSVSYTSWITSYPFTFKAPDEVGYCLIGAKHSNDNNISPNEIKENVEFILYEGLGSDDYYKFCGIKDVRDTLDTSKGEIVQRIGKIVLDGSENWRLDSTTSGNQFVNDISTLPLILNLNKSRNVICSHFITDAKSAVWLELENKKIMVHPTNMTYFRIRYDECTTVTEFKNYLKEQYDNGTPVIVYYVLAEPYTIQIKPTKIKLFEGVNNISVEDKYGLANDMKVTYYQDWHSLVDKQDNAVAMLPTLDKVMVEKEEDVNNTDMLVPNEEVKVKKSVW